MVRQLAIALVLIAGADPPTDEGQDGTPGNPPHILIASSIDADGNLQLVTYKTIYIGFDGYSYNERSLQKPRIPKYSTRARKRIDYGLTQAD